jgi:phosphoribosylformylglycinamidine cyclo-ligase
MDKQQKAYAAAGVDIDLATRLLDEMKPVLKTASRPEVLGGIGGFGGLFDMSMLPQKNAVLVSSTDSCGTKVKVAVMAGKHEGLGHDIVNHCCNDVAVTGATPIFFLDYFAADKLEAESYTQILRGLSNACRAANVALIGGETAELPGVYNKGHYDLVGTIVGVAERSALISGETIRPGDKVIGVASNGLHTNGYSLARKVFFEQLGMGVHDKLPGFDVSVADALLAPHVNYAGMLNVLYKEFNLSEPSKYRKGNAVYGVAHITGGGLTGNVPRILPADVNVVVDTKAWERPPVFQVLAGRGGVSFDEQHEVWNMGVGLAIVVEPARADEILARIQSLGHKAWLIGEATQGQRFVELRGE